MGCMARSEPQLVVSSRGLIVLRLAVLILLTAMHGAGGDTIVPPAADLPGVLVWAPIDVTLAADRAEVWRSKGAAGFVFPGIVSGLDQDVWAVDGHPETVGPDDAILQKAHAAVLQLAKAGLSRNFVLVPFGPAGSYFIDSSEANRAIKKLQSVAEFVRTSEMRGLVLDVGGLPYFDDRWAGDPLETTARQSLLDGAAAFGNRSAHAIQEAQPGAEVIVAVDGVFNLSPLTLAFIQGLSEGLSDSPESRFHLLTRASLQFRSATDLKRLAVQAERMLAVHLSPHACERWRRNGSVALCLKPETVDGSSQAPRDNRALESFRVQLATARLYAGAYVCVLTDPDPDRLGDYTFNGPLDGLVRAGAMRAGGVQAEVLRGARGAALVFLEGSAESVIVTGRTLPVHVTDLSTAERETLTPKEGTLRLGPFSRPTLVEDLPVNEWVVPASLWLERGEAAPGRVTSLPVSYGWSDRSKLSFTGTLEAVVPKEFSLLPRTQAVDVASGETVAVSGVLQGRAVRGQTIPARLVLASPGAAPTQREFTISVPPELLWDRSLDAPVLVAPLLLDSEGTTEILMADVHRVACVDGSGHEVWRTELPGANVHGFAAYRHWTGQKFVAVLDDDGTLQILDGKGLLRWTASGEAPCAGCALRCANLHPFPGEELVLASKDGSVSAVLSNGQALWETQIAGNVQSIDTIDVDDDGRDECIALGDSLTVLDSDGTVLWASGALGADTQCPFLIADIYGEWQWTIVVGLENGRISCLNAGDGAVRAEGNLSRPDPVIGLACGELLPSPGQEILAATANRLYCLSSELAVLWQKPLDVSAPPRVVGEGEEAAILVPTLTGDLACLFPDGRERWRDCRAAGPLRNAPVIVSRAGTDKFVCLYGSDDHVVRAIQIP